jgi:hypothetical protein
MRTRPPETAVFGDREAGPWPAVRRWAIRTGLPIAAAGVIVAVTVSLAATARGLDSCGPSVAAPVTYRFAPIAAIDGDPTCHELVRSLSVRTGVGVGIAAVFLLAFFLGLQRTATVLDGDRRRWPAPLDRR